MYTKNDSDVHFPLLQSIQEQLGTDPRFWAMLTKHRAQKHLNTRKEAIAQRVIAYCDEVLSLPRTQAIFDSLQPLLETILEAGRNKVNSISNNIMQVWAKVWSLIQQVSSSFVAMSKLSMGAFSFLTNGQFLQSLVMLVVWIILMYFKQEDIANVLVGVYLFMIGGDLATFVGVVLTGSGCMGFLSKFLQIKHGNRHTVTLQQIPDMQGIDLDVLLSSSQQSYLALIIAVASGVFGLSSMSLLPTNYIEFGKMMNAHVQIARGFTTLSDVFSELTEKAIHITAHWWYGIDLETTKAIPADLEKLIDEIREFCTSDFRTSLPDSPENVERVIEAYTQFFELRVKYKDNRALVALMDKIQIPLINIHSVASSYNVKPIKSRIEPVVVMFRGGSGVGKSTVLYHIATEVLAEDGLITRDMTDEAIYEKINTCIYPRASENEYWEGYKKNPVTMVDDAFQVRDSSSNPSLDYLELIRMSNPFPYPLHMATLSAKADTTFESRCILYTTNERVIAPESLISSEAVIRRITMPYEVRVKREFADMHGRLKDEYKTGDINVEVYSFHTWNPQNGRVSKQGMSYAQMVAKLHKELQKKKVVFEKKANNLVAHARAIFDRENEAQEGSSNTVTQGLKDWIFRKVEESATYSIPAMNLWDETMDNIAQHFENGQDLDQNAMLLMGMIEQQTGAVRNFAEAEDAAEYLREDFVRAYGIYSERYLGFWESMQQRLGEVDEFIERNLNIVATMDAVCLMLSVLILGLTIYQLLTYEPPHWADRLPIIATYPDIDVVKSIVDLRMPLSEQQWPFIEKYLAWLAAMEVEGIDIEVTGNEKTFVLSTAESGKDRKFVAPIRFESGKDRKFEKSVQVESGKDRKFVPPIRIESGKDRKHNPKANIESTLTNLPATQAWVNSNAEQVAELAFSNQVSIDISVNGEKSVTNVQGVFLTGRTLLLNYHYTEKFDEFTKQGEVLLEICPTTSRVGTTVRWLDVRATARKLARNGEETDIVALEVAKVSRYPCLIKHLIRRDQLATLEGKRVALTSLHKRTRHSKFGRIDRVSVEQYNASTTRSATCISTDIGSVQGDCGAVYVLDDSSSSKKICGFHFAGSSGRALATPLVYEDWAKLLQQEVVLETIPQVPVIQGNCVSLGKAKRPVFQQSESKIMPTQIFNKVIESTMCPSRMDYRMDGPTLPKSLAKQFGPQPLVDADVLDQAAHSYQKCLSGTKSRLMAVLPFEQAVRGVDGDEYIRGVERSTSSGYPYSLDARGKGKQEWFGKDEWTLDSPRALEMKKIVGDQVELMEKGCFVEYVFTDTLKDETLPEVKVKNHKCRLFAAAPLDFLIVFRMYFMSFLAMMMENRIHNESAVGIRAHTMEWTELATHLRRTGTKTIAGDFSNYDGSLHVDVLNRILLIIEDYYRASPGYRREDTNVRRILWDNIINSTHICGDMVYRLNHSQPSGNPATAILNSMYNSIACRYVWFLESRQEFNDHVSMIAYGDDNVLVVDDESALWFTQEFMTEKFETIGMTYTDELKSGNSGFRELDQVQFIKRRFLMDNKVAYAALELSSILECFNWIHRTTDEKKVIMANFEMANIELALHDGTTFDYWMGKLQTAIYQAYHVCPPIQSRVTVRMQIRDPEFARQMAKLSWV